MSSATRRYTALCAIFSGAIAACGVFGPPPVVSAGIATPAEERADDPFARLEDRTAVPAFEFGVCTTDSDCAPTGCDGSICSPNDEPSICMTGPLAECFAAIPAEHCGCNEGVCRWDRTAPVLQCAVFGEDPPTNRPRTGTDPPEMYPIRVGE